MKGLVIKRLCESEGSRAVGARFGQLIREGKLDPREFSVRDLWESLVGPCSRTLAYAQRRSGVVHLAEAAVDSTAFADITGQVLMARALADYNQPGYVGDQLFDTVPSSRRAERIPGFVLQDATSEVEEGMPYPDAGITDRYVSVESGKKRGLLLSITEEAIFLDETGNLLTAAGKIGEFVRMNKETRQLNVFTGTTSNYYPAGVQTTIYSASPNANLIADNDLVDWTDLDVCLQTIAAQTDPEGDKIIIIPRVMVVPWARRMIALRIMAATELRSVTQPPPPMTADASAVTVTGNILAQLLGVTPSIITTPLLDDYDDGDEWYLGDPKRGFVYRQHWPFQSFQRRNQGDMAFTRDIVVQLKFREWGTAHCTDHRFVCKNAKA